jgi:hypothetical protein
MKIAIIGILTAATLASTAATPAQAQNGKNPPGVNPNHYHCYKITDSSGFKGLAVKLADQFQTSEAKVLKPVYLCAPVTKNNIAMRDKVTHLLCYEKEGGKPADKKAIITNQFGKIEVAVGAPELLCVPSLKQIPK